MTRKTKYIIIGVSVVAVSAFAYFYYFGINKQKAVGVIQSSGLTQGWEANALNALDEQFLISWAKAIRILKKTFEYNGKIYSTTTGAAAN